MSVMTLYTRTKHAFEALVKAYEAAEGRPLPEQATLAARLQSELPDIETNMVRGSGYNTRLDEMNRRPIAGQWFATCLVPYQSSFINGSVRLCTVSKYGGCFSSPLTPPSSPLFLVDAPTVRHSCVDV